MFRKILLIFNDSYSVNMQGKLSIAMFIFFNCPISKVSKNREFYLSHRPNNTISMISAEAGMKKVVWKINKFTDSE